MEFSTIITLDDLTYKCTISRNASVVDAKNKRTPFDIVVPEVLYKRWHPPYFVVEISDQAFEKCRNLTSVTLPDSVESIGVRAFSECVSLREIRLPDQITALPALTFYRCVNLESIVLPSSLRSIGYMSFFGCESLEWIQIPDNVTEIGSQAFFRCDRLAYASLPSGDINIAPDAFPSGTKLIIRKPAEEPNDIHPGNERPAME